MSSRKTLKASYRGGKVGGRVELIAALMDWDNAGGILFVLPCAHLVIVFSTFLPTFSELNSHHPEPRCSHHCLGVSARRKALNSERFREKYDSEL